MIINAKGIHYRVLNEEINQAIDAGEKEILLKNINGHRYIGCGIRSNAKIDIEGVAGNDLGAFMDGLRLNVFASGQDGIGNTMSGGKIVIHGDAGDITGHSMRGGQIYVKGNAGYRIGIHMKSYQQLYPVIVVGGSVGDFAGEYMAGGLLVVLGQNGSDIAGNYIGTGMHAGMIYINGNIEDFQLGKEVKKFELADGDWQSLLPYIKEYCDLFSKDLKSFKKENFLKIIPLSHRPYGRLYAY